MFGGTTNNKVNVEVNVVEEFCSIPFGYETDSYAQELCEKWEKKEPNTDFAYYIDIDRIDDMSGETIGYIYRNDRVHFHIDGEQ